MKRILFLAVLLALCGAGAHAQNTIVTATVVDPNGNPYQAGFGQSSIQCPGNAQPYRNGSPLTRSIPIPALDGTGSFTVSLWDTVGLTDANGAPLTCQWRVQITDHCQVATFAALLTGITGAGPVNVSSQINAVAVPVSAMCTPPGLVKTVTLSNLPPLFTVTETGAPVNPLFTFNLSTAAANTVFANCTGGAALPSFCSITPGMLPGGIGSVSSFSSGNLSPLFNTAVATPTTTPAQSFTAQNAGANLILAGPSGGNFDTAANTSGNSTTLSATATPATTAEAAIFIGTVANASQGGPFSPSGGGWTVLDGSSNNYDVSAHAISSLSPFTASATITSAQWVETLLLFGSSGGNPTVVHQTNLCSGAFTSGPQTCTTPYSSAPTAGNGMLVLLTSSGGTGNVSVPVATDTLFNKFYVLAINNGTTVRQVLLYARNLTGGAGSITLNWTNSATTTATSIAAYELSGLNNLSAPYVFRPATSLDLPLPGANTLGGVDSAAKITHQWIDTINPDGTIHQSQPTVTDISGLGGTQTQTFTFCASGCSITGTPCTISSGASYDVCTNTITWPTTWADTNYAISCNGLVTSAHASAGNGSTNYALTIFPQQGNRTVNTFVAVTQNQRTNTAAFDEIDCIGSHP
jgi:hypothetical protein